MIDHNTILSFNHYKKGKPFTGSLNGMRYRIIKEAAKDEDDTDKFRVDTWPEPLCYEATDPDKITVQLFAFTEEGYGDVLSYLNDKYSEYAVQH
ncbi:MAG: GNAT family acetyltransferase [Lachnospiraceae bacterium]|nr:GNAT family acetyltransferase [Lachnospiraceae bacterium]